MLVRLIAILVACLVLFAVIIVAAKNIEKGEERNKKDFLDEIEEVSKRVKELK
jgi:Mn2+/Fe2+ NRAMP family transporter